MTTKIVFYNKIILIIIKIIIKDFILKQEAEILKDILKN